MMGRFIESLRQLREDIEKEKEAKRAIEIMDNYAELYENPEIYEPYERGDDYKWYLK